MQRLRCSKIHVIPSVERDMAAEILNEVLAGNVAVDSVVAWLILRNPDEEGLPQLEYASCARGPFILHFLNYLRNETVSVLKSSFTGTTPIKTAKSRGENENLESLSASKKNENRISKTRKVELFPCDSQPKSTCEAMKNVEKHLSNETVTWNSRCSSEEFSEQKYSVGEQKNKNHHAENRDNSKSSTKKKISVVKLDNVTPNSKCSQFSRVSQFLSPTDSPERSQSILNAVSPLSRGSSDPISPSHSWENTQSPGRSNRPTSTFSLSDYIVKDNSRNSVKKRGHKGQAQSHGFCDISEENLKSAKLQKRRIKPTRLVVNQNEKISGQHTADQASTGFGVIKRPLEPSTPFREVQVLEKLQPSSSNFQQERDMLRQERLKQQTSCRPYEEDAGREGCSITVIPPKLVQRLSPVLPQPDLVTCREQLHSLCHLYCQLFNSGLLPNITAEMHFITSLIIAEERTEEEAAKGCFGTVHNCVFFASSVLDQLRPVLELLDMATLQLLISNKAVELFAPDLHKHLQKKLGARAAEGKPEVIENLQSSVDNVTYRPDEDNRDNFPTDQAFYAFRKQRDAFYELWQIWETEHNLHNWSFSAILGARIRSLLGLYSDPSNYIHLARLFRLQLLTTCRGSENDCENENIDDSMLALLKDSNPKKYALLRARLVTPSKGRGPCPVPTFPGHQEFYKNFLLEASHSIFNQHLSDSLANEILSLDCTDFSASDIGDTDTSVDESTRKEYEKCLRTIRLLAKFLGFVNFLPYHTLDNIPDKIHVLHTSIRAKVPPSFDVLSALQAAVRSRRLVLTVPWVVKYLAMLDTVSLRLPYYEPVLRLLFTIHRYPPPELPKHAALLLRLCLGWLFDQPHFPDGLYFSWLSSQQAEAVPMEPVASSPLDLLHLVDEHCVYICCPYWGVLRTTLAEDPHSRSHRSLRHITPVAADPSRQTQSTSTRQLELQLEESFFHGHPASMKKTVEFVAERVASAFVKHVCNKLLPQQKKKDIVEIQVLIAESDSDYTAGIFKDKTPKEKANEGVALIARLASESLAKQAIDGMESFCTDRITTSLQALLAEDVAQQVVEACSGISLRLYKERVSNWVHLHITPDLFIKDYRVSVNKAFRSSGRADMSRTSHLAPVESRKVCHNDNTISPRVIINELREMTWRLLSNDVELLSASEVCMVMMNTLEMLRSREDIISSAERVIHSLILDLIVLLVVHRPAEVSGRLLHYASLLLATPQLGSALDEGRLERILSPRNVELLEQSRDPYKSWKCLAMVLSTFLRDCLMMPERLEEQCVALLRHPWPQNTLDRISVCIKNVIETYRKSNKDEYNEFVMLMELVSDLCDGMEDFEDF